MKIDIKKGLFSIAVVALMMPVSAQAEGGGAKHYMKMMDTNGDGQISAQEHAAAAAKRFSMADTNGDGMLTREELKAAKTMKKEHKGMGKDKKEEDHD